VGLHVFDKCDLALWQELVALEEQIGYVSTGLTESYIKENLRINLYVPRAACTSDQSPVENDGCIICQVLPLPHFIYPP
jgi:hypothetical protein